MRGRVASGGRVMLGVLVLGGCEIISVPQVATPAIAEEHMPSPAGITVVGEPPVALSDLALSLRLPTDPAWSQDATIEDGAVVTATFGVSAQRYLLLGQGGGCSIDLTLPPETETVVPVETRADGSCAFGRPAIQAWADGAGGAISGTVMLELGAPDPRITLRARSLEDPPWPTPDAAVPDEGGLTLLGGLQPGRWEVTLVRDGVAAGSIVVAIATPEIVRVDLEDFGD